MKIRTLIVDDESLARDRLRQLLTREAEVELVGECADGREAVTFIEQKKPDLVFLDVQMPELDGFSVLAELEGKPLPVIVFVTAHDRFALRAFEVHAVDYLLKPFDRERFEKALARALEQVKRREDRALIDRQAALLAELKPAVSPERLAVKSGGHVLWVELDEIDWIGSADNYAELHLGAKSHLMRETLSALEARLDPQKFVRISRSIIVNARRIKELKRLFYGGCEITLQSGTKLTLSRRYRDKLEQLGVR
ncbi:MAG TPA: LytTR family DNA-binding domain-containing protein [Verrucomicrobiae bacterium]|nr:LytTR family DNA-binding domain-containing protein [Verrucomicrobiae bacterium]